MSLQESLGEKQRRFCKDVGKLIEFIYAMGWAATFGDAYRDPGVARFYAQAGKGIANSLHTQRLAIDLNLIIKGEYQAKTETYLPLGEFWESLGDDHAWGGRFSKPDGNHFSIQHQGRR